MKKEPTRKNLKEGENKGRNFRLSKINYKKFSLLVFLVLLIVLLGFLAYLNAGLFLVAMVNNRPIWRIDLIKQLEKQGGKQVADALVNKSLVYQEAAKRNITVSDEEVNSEYSKLENQFKSQGVSLQDAMAIQGLKESDVREELKYSLLLKSLLADKIGVSDQEAKDYFDKNKEMFDKTKSFDDLKADIKDFLTNQKLSQAYQSFIEELKSSSKIRYFANFN